VLDLTAADPTWNGELVVPAPAETSPAAPPPATIRERILVIDSDPDTRGLLEVLLQQRGSSVRTAATAEEALAEIDRTPPDLVILDTEIAGAAPELDGVVRGLEGAGDLVVCRLASAMPLEGGDATQWIVRPFDPAAAVGRAAALLERRRLLADHSLQDPVTGVLNRRAFLERLTTEIARRDRSRRPLAVGVTHVALASPEASAWGQGVTHRVLKAAADALLHSVRQYDVVGRWAADRFALALADVASDGAHAAAQRVLNAVRTLAVPVRGGQPAAVDAWLGLLCSRPADARDAGSLVESAAAACDRARSNHGPGLEVVDQ
jgi:diguanylate cyclase (GGDEF)-like protein